MNKHNILTGLLLPALVVLSLPAVLAAQATDVSPEVASPEQAQALAYYHFTMGHHYEEMAGLSRRPDYIANAIEEFKLALQYAPGSSLLTARLAEAYRRGGRIRDAVQELQAVLQADPNDLTARRVLGRIYYQTLGDSPEHARGRATLGLAVEQYEHITRLDPESSDDLLILARLYRFNNEMDKSEEALGKLLDIDPGSEDAMSELAYIYLSRGESQKAIDLLQGTAVQSSSTELLSRLADAYKQKGDLDSAIDIYRRAVQSDTDNIRLRGMLGDALTGVGRHREALAEYEAINGIDRANLVVLLRMAQSHRALGDLAEAEDVLDEAWTLHPGNLDVALTRALVKEEQGDFDGAVEMLEETLKGMEREDGRYNEEEADDRATVLEQLGMILRRGHKFPEAYAAFEQLRDLGLAHRHRYWVQTIETQRQERKLDAAVLTARAAVAEFDNDVGLALQLAGVLGEAGDVEAALEIVASEEGGGNDPVQLQLTLFQIYERNKMFDEAFAAVDGLESIGREGLEAYSHYLRGALYYRMEDFDKAEESYRRALEIDPDDAGTLNDLGYMLADKNRKLDEALSMLQRAVKKEPNNSAYLDSLAWAHFRLKNMEEAERYLLQAIERNSTDPTLYDHLGEVYAATDRLLLAEQAWERATQLWNELPENDLDQDQRAQLEEKLRNLKTRLARRSPVRGSRRNK